MQHVSCDAQLAHYPPNGHPIASEHSPMDQEILSGRYAIVGLLGYY